MFEIGGCASCHATPADDPQKVAWVNLSERDSLLGRMLAHFSLILSPSALYAPLP